MQTDLLYGSSFSACFWGSLRSAHTRPLSPWVRRNVYRGERVILGKLFGAAFDRRRHGKHSSRHQMQNFHVNVELQHPTLFPVYGHNIIFLEAVPPNPILSTAGSETATMLCSVCVCPKRHGEWIHFTGMRSWVWDVLHQNTYCMFLINSCLFSLILKNNWVLLTFFNSVLFGSHKVKSCVLKTAIVSATVTNRVFIFISVLWIGFMNIHEIRETEFHVSFTLSTTFGAGHLTANIQSIHLPFEVNDHKAKE